MDFPLRSSQFNKKQQAKAQKMQDALESKQSALKLQDPESTTGKWGEIREGFTEDMELELSLEGHRGKYEQILGTPPSSFPTSTDRCQTEPVVTFQVGAICNLFCHMGSSGSQFPLSRSPTLEI